MSLDIGRKGSAPKNGKPKGPVRTFYKQEDLIHKAAGTESNRIARYTRKTDHAFVDAIYLFRTPTMDAINAAWF